MPGKFFMLANGCRALEVMAGLTLMPSLSLLILPESYVVKLIGRLEATSLWVKFLLMPRQTKTEPGLSLRPGRFWTAPGLMICAEDSVWESSTSAASQVVLLVKEAGRSAASFVLAGYTTEEVGRALNEEGIAVRSGHHCAQPILRR